MRYKKQQCSKLFEQDHDELDEKKITTIIVCVMLNSNAREIIFKFTKCKTKLKKENYI